MVLKTCPFKSHEAGMDNDNKCDLLCALLDQKTNECIIARTEIDLQRIATNTGHIYGMLLPE